ncbi:MAG: hypothetical protein GY708_03925 [Actinomycetia bacterium]|nr:hypothetical protein [Actinomycetes bacterium]MCP4958423.1 hypothetical protein [Actinomycetes bacterium]
MTRRTLVATVAALAILAGCGGDSDDTSTDTTQAPDATATSTPGSTTSTTATSTTATESTETTEPTTTTEAAPQTTAPPVTVDPGPTGFSLHGGGLGPVTFGLDAATVTEFMGGVLGPPGSDSGWVDSFSQFGTCPGSEVRGVTYGSLQILFGGPDDDRTFFSWAYFDQGAGDVYGLQTPEGIGLGSTREVIDAAYPGTVFHEADVIPASASFSNMWATFDDAGVVMYISGGSGCGE